MFSHLLLAAALLFHAGQQPFSFQAQQLTRQLAVKSSAIHGVIWYPVHTGASLAHAPKRFPLILLSHGTGGAARQLAWLGTALARAGFIAAAIDHPGDNNIGEPTVQGFTLWWLRARELSMALDSILANRTFGPRIDTARIGAAGFSLGGYTVLALAGGRVDLASAVDRCKNDPQSPSCQSPPEFPDLVPKMLALRARDASYANAIANSNVNVADPRVRAVYAIAPSVGDDVTLDSLHDIALPVRIAYGTSDTIAPPALNALRYANWIPDATTLPVLNAGHYTFLDACTAAVRTMPAACVDSPGVNRDAVHATVAADVIDFFSR